MIYKNLPHDLNAEVLLEYLGDRDYKVIFDGPHHRNNYKDILEVEEDVDHVQVRLSRRSIYNTLPENLFHSIERFDELPETRRYNSFLQEYDTQQEEKRKAYAFFAPIDLLLLSLRQQIRRKLDQYVSSDTVMQSILADRLTEQQLLNPFIRQTIPFLPNCRDIRGDITLITLLLRKVFAEEGIRLTQSSNLQMFFDEEPRYSMELGSDLGSVYLGDGYEQPILGYYLTFWPADTVHTDFMAYVEQLDEYRRFFEDYFLGVGTILTFTLIDPNAMTLRLGDDEVKNYLNFNTTI